MTDSQKQVFCKPKTPFTGLLQGGLQEGKSVIVIGTISQNATRGRVNLQYGSKSGDDIALHFNPRYDDDGPAYVVLNTFQEGNWGPERSADFFILKGGTFILQILVTKYTYKVLVNGKHFMDYKHRINPFTVMDTISVDEMVDLDFIAYQNPEVVPYSTQITGGLQPGKDIVVYGLTNADYKSIELKLTGNGNEVLYESNFGNNLAVLRTHKDAENKSGVPLKKDELFQVTISCNKEQFTVTVNDQPALTCMHRFAKLEDINLFEVNGDLQLIFVNTQ